MKTNESVINFFETIINFTPLFCVLKFDIIFIIYMKEWVPKLYANFRTHFIFCY